MLTPAPQAPCWEVHRGQPGPARAKAAGLPEGGWEKHGNMTQVSHGTKTKAGGDAREEGRREQPLEVALQGTVAAQSV